MPRQFRLAKVLEARRTVERQRKQALAAAERTHAREQAVHVRLQEKIAAHREQALQPPEGRLDVRRETALRAILQQLAEDARRQSGVVEQCRQRVEAGREALVKAARDRKVLENLEERAREAGRREDEAREQIEMDEIARQTFVRGSAVGAGARRAGQSGEETP